MTSTIPIHFPLDALSAELSNHKIMGGPNQSTEGEWEGERAAISTNAESHAFCNSLFNYVLDNMCQGGYIYS